MYCSNCGNQVATGNVYCQYCGQALSTTTSPHEERGRHHSTAPMIACFTPNCRESVVGQCPGYPDDKRCGKFFCHTHSYEAKLCQECSDLLFRDTLIKDYSDTANAINSEVTKSAQVRRVLIWLLLAVMIFVAERVMSSITNIALDQAFCLSWVGIFLIICAVVNRRGWQHEGRLVAEMDTTKSGFAEFYKEWKRNKQWEQLALAGAITVGAIAAMSSSAAEDAKIRRAVDEEISKRGL